MRYKIKVYKNANYDFSFYSYEIEAVSKTDAIKKTIRFIKNPGSKELLIREHELVYPSTNFDYSTILVTLISMDLPYSPLLAIDGLSDL